MGTGDIGGQGVPLTDDAVGERLFAGFIDFGVAGLVTALLSGVHKQTLTSSSNPNVHGTNIWISLDMSRFGLFIVVSLVYSAAPADRRSPRRHVGRQHVRGRDALRALFGCRVAARREVRRSTGTPRL
jgi:hypothetical protein